MPDELDLERERGRALAAALVEHLRVMNAAALEIPVVMEDETYIVTVMREDFDPEA